MMSYREVYEFYNKKSRELINRHSRILKTDCHNETRDKPAILPSDDNVYLVEYSDVVIKTALLKNPNLNVKQGDIRDLEFPNEFFDCVIDLSTIDHIAPEDVAKVLKEYNRVTQQNSEIMIVVWLSNEETRYPYWEPGHQYHFLQSKVEFEINKYFRIVESDTLLREAPRYLHYYLLHKD